MSLKKLVDEINTYFVEDDCIAGGVLYGLAQTVVRTRGNEVEFLPGLVANDGEVTYVGVDDDFDTIIYHKSLSITCSSQPGRGDNYDIVNSYNNALIVYNERKRNGYRPDQLLLLLQSVFPSTIQMPPYSSAKLRFNNVDLDSMGVFRREYQGTDFKLHANQDLFQINYSIETVFNKHCFDTCTKISSI